MLCPDIKRIKQKLINRETILYGIVGAGTSILNVALFHVLVKLTGLLREIGRFIIARGTTMLIDYFGLIVLVEYMHVAKLPGKCFVTVLVIVLNYVIGKKHVFKDTRGS